jgi:hypothetical protein
MRELSAVLALAISSPGPLSAFAQTAMALVDDSHTGRDHLAQTLTFEYKIEKTGVPIDSAVSGNKVTMHQVISVDSQGRQLFATNSDPSYEANTRHSVDDHIAGTRTVWKADNTEAEVLKLPAGLPGRDSCWQFEPTEEDRSWGGGGPFLFFRTTCFASEQHYCYVFGPVGGAPNPYFPKGTSVAKASYSDCQFSLKDFGAPGETRPVGTGEDLGTQTILGFEAHGCRMFVRDGYTDERWVVAFGSMALVLRELSQVPVRHMQGIASVIEKKEMTRMSLDEPDPATFQPPQDYSIKTVEMHPDICRETDRARP